MGPTVTLAAEDGHRLGAYRAAPAGRARGGLVVVQEIFGVNVHLRRVCDGFAADGYAALAPALFDRAERDVALGYGPSDIERGRALRDRVGLDRMVRDIGVAAASLRGEGLAVGVVGYCMGGTLAWLAAARVDGLAAAVCYYGGGIADAAGERPRCPVLLHFGESDASIPREHRDRVAAAHPEIPAHLYPAGHGFNCDLRASYHEPSATLARRRTLDFLRRHLG